jgi:hypothetical protein
MSVLLWVGRCGDWLKWACAQCVLWVDVSSWCWEVFNEPVGLFLRLSGRLATGVAESGRGLDSTVLMRRNIYN